MPAIRAHNVVGLGISGVDEGAVEDVTGGVNAGAFHARVVTERLWHSNQAIRKLKPDGSVIEFQADLSGFEEITRWVLSWGSKAKVLGPPELKKQVREELEKMVLASA
jgi:predicted DNA-binding transcriptional regulator YafY